MNPDTSLLRSSWRTRCASVFLMGYVASMIMGCSLVPPAKEDPTRHYVLGRKALSDSAVETQRGLEIGLGRVEIPAYLRTTKSIVVRRNGNEVVFNDFARWAEPLESGIAGLVKDRLVASGVVGSVHFAPFPMGRDRDFDLQIHVIRCEGAILGDGRGVALFEASYELIPIREGKRSKFMGTFVASEKGWDGIDFGALAMLLGQSVDELSLEIASRLK